MDSETFVILFAHGSKSREANEGIELLAGDLERVSGLPTHATFLEFASPDLAGAAAAASLAGARRIIVVPCFLTMGMHVREDLPRLLSELRSRHTEVEVLASAPLEGHGGLASILLDRVREALGAAAPLPERK